MPLEIGLKRGLDRGWLVAASPPLMGYIGHFFALNMAVGQ